MELFFQSVLLLVGLGLLWKMGELCVRHALGFSALFGVHQFIIGLLIFSLSTGLPEISAAIVSSLNKVPELSVGDLIGSAFVNMSLLLGLFAIVAKEMEVTFYLRNKLLKSLFAMALLMLTISLLPLGGVVTGTIFIGVYFVSIFWFQGGVEKKDALKEIKEIESAVEVAVKKPVISEKVDILFKLFGSILLLLLASWILVHSASKVAKMLEIKLSFLGGTVLAVGTSFPELALGFHSIRKREYSLVFGNIFGASLLNLSFSLGVLMLLNPGLNLSYVFKVLPFMGLLFVWIFQKLVRNKGITRGDGFFFLFLFLFYLGVGIFSIVL